MRGATRARAISCTTLRISIHAPHAGCDGLGWEVIRILKISIHAPHAGCDKLCGIIGVIFLNFNPRTPCGVRHARGVPLRGFLQISIHAPHAGCDRRKSMNLNDILISIHAPHAGCDIMKTGLTSRTIEFQSTHPMRGATCGQVYRPRGEENFNPRTPCGVRRWVYQFRSNSLRFQSTHPMRGATCYANMRRNMGLFQSTHPMRGATLADSIVNDMKKDFNPRTPCGVRPYILYQTEDRTADKGRTH